MFEGFGVQGSNPRPPPVSGFDESVNERRGVLMPMPRHRGQSINACTSADMYANRQVYASFIHETIHRYVHAFVLLIMFSCLD